MTERKEKKMETHYLTVDEAADILGVHYMTVYKMIKAKQIPAVRVGRMIRIPNNFTENIPAYEPCEGEDK